MARILKRRYVREAQPVAATGTTGLIKIGFNAGKSEEIKAGKFNGFVLYRDTLGSDNKFIIDYDSMGQLGYSKNQIEQAQNQGFKAEASLLPQELHFILIGDAILTDSGYAYPSIFEENYECYGKTGLMCSGNGDSASRKQPDGSKKIITCNPFGKTDVDPIEYCEFSGPKKPCKDHARLVVCLLFRDSENRLKPLLPRLGMQAKFRLDTSSEYGAIGILSALDAAAERLNGQINGITGTLSFQKKARRTGDETFSKSIVGHVFFQLHEESIRAKERMLGGRFITNCIPQVEMLPPPQKQITYQKPEPEIKFQKSDTPKEPARESAINIKERVKNLNDEEALSELRESLQYLSEISGKDSQDWMAEFTKSKDGKFINTPDGFFVMKDIDSDRHRKAMVSLRDTLAKCLIAIALIEEREEESCVK